MHSFGNDRTGFYNRMEHENEAFVNAKAYDGNIQIRSTNNVYPKMKTVVARQGNALNNAALAGQMRRRNGAKSSIVGPTIKNNSRLASYFPNIQQHKATDVTDEGIAEPTLKSRLQKQDSESVEIDGINFWSGTDKEVIDAVERAKRRFSLSMIDKPR